LTAVTTELTTEDPVTAGADAPRVSPRRERTRERLLDAAYEKFAEHGINGTSIEAVCEAAGFTRGAFYSNFESKEELFLALADREVRVRIANLEAAARFLPEHPLEDGRLSPDALAPVIAAVMADSHDERRWHLMSAELELLALRDPRVARRHAAQEESFCAELAAILERVLEHAGLRFVVDPAVATRLLVGAYTSLARDAFLTASDDEDAARRTRESELLPVLASRLVEAVPAA